MKLVVFPPKNTFYLLDGAILKKPREKHHLGDQGYIFAQYNFKNDPCKQLEEENQHHSFLKAHSARVVAACRSRKNCDYTYA
jgi:hypothetical protein